MPTDSGTWGRGIVNQAYQVSDAAPEGYQASEGGDDEMREWEVAEWNGGVLRSPRQSLRVVNA